MVTSRINGVSGNLSVKIPARVATTAPITINGEQVIDGVSIVDGDRVLVKDQADLKINGMYIASTGNWARSIDFNGNNDIVDGTFFLVKEGTQNVNSYWRVVSVDDPVVLGESLVSFTQIFIGLSATFSSLQESDFMLYDMVSGQFVNKTLEQVKTALGITDGDEGQSTWRVKRFESGVNFTPDVTTQISLDSAPGSENNCFIFFQGVYQEKPEFGLSGTTITFTDPIPTGVTSVEVVHGSAVTVGVPEDASVDTAKLADLAITFGKLATALLASVSDMVAGTANKILTATNFKTYMDTNYATGLRVVAVANYDTSSTSLVVNSQLGMTAVRTSTGLLTVTLNDAMISDDYVVQLAFNNAGLTATNSSVSMEIIDATTFKVRGANTGGNSRDGLFMITVIGEKA